MPLGYAHLIGEDTHTYIHHITFIQRYLDIDCGFQFGLRYSQKKMIVGFAGFSSAISSQVTQLRMSKIV